MADAAVGTVINKLTKLAGQEVQLLLQVVKDVKFIADKFEWLQALLNDAEQKRRTSKKPFVALWIKQARDTTFEMEDVLDDFSRKVEEVRLPCYGSWKDVLKFGWATDCFTRVVVKHGLSSKIENIKIKLAMLEDDKQTYGLDLNPSSSSWIPSLDKTIPTWAKEDYSKTLVGLDSQAQELIAQLKDGADQERKVISIVGDRGSGTVMLAKKVYDSSEIQSHFEVGAWKNLPQKFRLKETLADIYFKILEQEGKVEEDCTHKGDMGKMLEQEGKVEEDNTREDDVMGKALLGLLKNRRYLIVLNGLDNLACWKKVILSQYLPDDKNGSRIILIPKIGSEFASLSYIDGVTAFEQKLSFNSNDSIELFLQRFPEKYVYLRKYGEYIRQIYGVTNGHPMTIVLLAGLLGSKHEVSNWEEVFTYLKASKKGYRTYQTCCLCALMIYHTN